MNIWNFETCNFFADYLSRAQGQSKNVSNVIDLYHIKKRGGGSPGSGIPPPRPLQTILGKPDVNLNKPLKEKNF